MGNDAFIFCVDCRQREHIGRAYIYKPELINKKLDAEFIEKLKVILARFYGSLEGLLLADAELDLFAELVAFADEHKGHNLWLIDDFAGDHGINMKDVE
jgi:hypothetical protein